MDVAADLERSLQLEQSWLLQEDLPGLEAQAPDLGFGQLHRTDLFRTPAVEDPLDDVVDVDFSHFVSEFFGVTVFTQMSF